MGGTTIRRLIGREHFTASVQRFVIQQPSDLLCNSTSLNWRSRSVMCQPSLEQRLGEQFQPINEQADSNGEQESDKTGKQGIQ